MKDASCAIMVVLLLREGGIIEQMKYVRSIIIVVCILGGGAIVQNHEDGGASHVFAWFSTSSVRVQSLNIEGHLSYNPGFLYPQRGCN